MAINAVFKYVGIRSGAGVAERNVPAIILSDEDYNTYVTSQTTALLSAYWGKTITINITELDGCTLDEVSTYGKSYTVSDTFLKDFLNKALDNYFKRDAVGIAPFLHLEPYIERQNYANIYNYYADFGYYDDMPSDISDGNKLACSQYTRLCSSVAGVERRQVSNWTTREILNQPYIAIQPLGSGNSRPSFVYGGTKKALFVGAEDRLFIGCGNRDDSDPRFAYLKNNNLMGTEQYRGFGGVFRVGGITACYVLKNSEIDADGGLRHITEFLHIYSSSTNVLSNNYDTGVGGVNNGNISLTFNVNRYNTTDTPDTINDFNSSNLYVAFFEPVDPLADGGISGSSEMGYAGVQPDGTNAGGDGTFTLQSDDVPESALPPIASSLIGSGCGTVYCDSGSNVRSLMSYMWTHADDIIANLKKIIANPIDSILGLHIIPVVPSVGTSKQVYLGNVGTGVNMTPVTNPYLRYRLGSLTINKYWGSALDFNPFTQFNIHLPYIGFRQLNTDDLMGSTVELYYDIDVISGACVAHLKVTRTDPLTKETHVVDQYSWAGNCAMQIPVTSTNYQGLYSAIFNSVVAVASGIAGAAVGGLIGAGGEVAGKTLATGIAHSATNTANNLFNGGSKIRVEKSGNVSGAHGFLDSQYAYIERVTPRQSLASNYREVLGYPSNTTQILGTCTGFTQVEDINLENFSCTADEKDELERLLKGGVLF